MIFYGLFEEYLRAEESLFKNQFVLDPNYLPAKLPHREGQIEEIAISIKPLINGNRPRNLFIHGPTGVGKTAVSKYIVLEEFPKATSTSKPIYINCWNYNTRFSILSKILSSIGIFAPTRGISFSESYEKLENYLRKKEKNLLIILDEVDQLITKEDQKIIYDLLRIENGIIGLILISNDPYALTYLDERIKSSLNPGEIEFKPYKIKEIFDILKDRAKLAFVPKTIKKEHIRKISNFVFEYGGDIRLGLNALKNSGRLAEEDAKRKISLNHIEKAIGKIKKSKIIERIKRLKERKEKVYEILEGIASLELKNEKITSGKVREWFKEKNKKMSRRTISYALNEIEKLEMIEMEDINVKPKGKTRKIKLKIPTDTILKNK